MLPCGAALGRGRLRRRDPWREREPVRRGSENSIGRLGLLLGRDAPRGCERRPWRRRFLHGGRQHRPHSRRGAPGPRIRLESTGMRLFSNPPSKEKRMPTTKHLPDQPIMKYVHPADRLRPWFGVALGLAALVGMLAFGILGRDFGTLKHLQALNDAGGWLTISLIEASAGILALLLAALTLGERIERGVEGPHFISLIRLTARGGFATIAPAVFFDVLKVTTT